jgi:hypothetical protein
MKLMRTKILISAVLGGSIAVNKGPNAGSYKNHQQKIVIVNRRFKGV